VNQKTSKTPKLTSASQSKSARTPESRACSTSSVTYDTSARILRFGNIREDTQLILARTTLSAGTDVTDDARAAMNDFRSELSAEAVQKFRDYAPDLPSVDVDTIRSFVVDSITLALPKTTYAVETLLLPVTQFVHWAVFVVGCELNAALIFDRDLIDSWVRDELPAHYAPGTRRNYRAWVSRVAEVANPDKNPRAPMPLNARSMSEPYSENDIVALDRWASGQPTPYLRSNAAVLVALGAGAGLSSIEIVQVQRQSVSMHDDGTVTINVVVKGEHKRQVVVSAEFEKTIAKQVQGLPPEAFVFLPRRSRTENDVVSAFVARTTHPTGTPSVTVRRLRNTWFVTQLTNRVDVLSLMDAAGLESLESISKLARFVPRPTSDERIAQLRGVL
jgi:hypothetical protein